MTEHLVDQYDITPPGKSKGLVREALLKPTQLSRKKLCVVQAPPGYGKTVFLAQAYHAQSTNSIWLNIREKDKDPVAFLRKIDEALNVHHKNKVENRYCHAFDGLAPPSLSPWLLSIVGEMNGFSTLNIFINDCDLLNGSESSEILSNIIRDTAISVRFYVTTVTDIQFNHSYLIMNEQLVSIKQDDLLFTYDDIKKMYLSGDDTDSSESFILNVERLTEGWPVAVNYFLNNIVNNAQFEDFVARFKHEKIEFDRYFLENVFDNQSSFTQKLILKLCLIDRFNIDICLLLSDDELEARNFFTHLKDSILISPDDGSTHWFRFHRLFIVFLEKKSKESLSRSEIASCRMTTARWLMEQNSIEEAIELAFSSGDLSQAAIWLEYAFPYIVLKKGLHNTFLKWINWLPESVLEIHPVARVGAIWSLSLSRKTMLAFEQIKILEHHKPNYCLDIQKQITRTIGLCICAEKALKDEVGSVTEEISQWIDLWGDLSNFNNPNEFHFEVGIAFLVKGYCKKCTSEFDDAKSALLQSQKHFLARENFYGLTWSKSMLAVSYAKQGFHYEALQEALSGYAYAKEKLGEKSHLGFGLASLIAAINYEHDELESAKVYITDVIDYLKEQGSTDLLIAGFETKSRLLFNEGFDNEAIGFLKDSIRWAEEHQLSRLMLRMVDELVVSLLRKNQEMDAERYLSQYNLILVNSNDFNIEDNSHKIAARCITLFYIEKEKYDEAESTLNQLILRSESTGQQRRSADWYKLLAIVHHRKNNHELAISALRKALELSVSQGYIRMFIDDAYWLLPILKLFVDQNKQSNEGRFVDNILKQISDGISPKFNELVEGLTVKEIEIIKLLQEGMTNKMNAERLGVSEGTLKWHLHNIYSKFLVKNRAQALLKARELGYLDED